MTAIASATQAQDASHVLRNIRTTYEYEVTGKPDTKGPGKGAVTVRPEKVEIRFVDGKVRWISVWGRTIRRDGQITGYRDAGFATNAYIQGQRHVEYDELPDWVLDLLDDEGIRWPNGREPSRLDHDAAVEAGIKGVREMMRAEEGDAFEEPDAEDLAATRDKMDHLVAVILPAAEGR